MQIIKCPNCGSEKCKSLTEEKYVCLACDNVFLIHNLSKEFKQTDEHISEIHKDLKEEIFSLSENMLDSASVKRKEILAEARLNLKRENYLDAYDDFEEYLEYAPDSYEGYYGMFCALTENLTCDYTSSSDERICDGFDMLVKALDCEDCDKEKVLSSVKDYYLKAKKTLVDKMVYYLKDESITERIQKLENWNIQGKETLEKYNNSTLLDKIRQNAVKLAITAVVVMICLLLGNKVGDFSSGLVRVLFKIVGIAIYAITIAGGLFAIYKILGKPYVVLYDEEINRLKEFEKMQAISLSEMEEIIRTNEQTGNSAEEMYNILVEIEEEEQEENQRESEPLRRLILVRRGNKKALINLLMEIGNTKRFAIYAANANEPVEILYGCRDSRATELQREFLNETNSVVDIV